jgi:hypothetical protein
LGMNMGTKKKRNWYVYDERYNVVLSGYSSRTDAKKEAIKVRSETETLLPKVLGRNNRSIQAYAKTHPAFARREELEE